MNGWSAVFRTGLGRALAVVGVIAGVLAMHGLTSGHHPVMPDMGTVGQMAAADIAGPELHDPEVAMTVDAGAVKATPRSGSALDGLLTTSTAGHLMADVCVAVLTVTLLLLALATALRRRRIWCPVTPRSTTRRPRAVGRPPPWTHPSPSKLCVLRT
ncbi:DUF6153 family protein [Kribbella sp. DT2]|uniref:DUF6153 family protein n=1 Tax=Kribbella sp. DT2 TaxID=3393427 RepID=UPI003CF534FD